MTDEDKVSEELGEVLLDTLSLNTNILVRAIYVSEKVIWSNNIRLSESFKFGKIIKIGGIVREMEIDHGYEFGTLQLGDIVMFNEEKAVYLAHGQLAYYIIDREKIAGMIIKNNK